MEIDIKPVHKPVDTKRQGMDGAQAQDGRIDCDGAKEEVKAAPNNKNKEPIQEPADKEKGTTSAQGQDDRTGRGGEKEKEK